MMSALAAAGAVAYSTSFAGVFVFDDKPAIVNNPNIKTLWPLTTAMSAPPEVAVSGRPVASLTLALNYALAPADVRDVLAPGGLTASPTTADRFLRNVWGYHLFNLMLHVCAALALLGVVRRTLSSDRLRTDLGNRDTALAFAAVLVWLVHPLLTDAVTYVTQRTEVLMGLFYFLTLYCAIRAGERGVGTRVRSWWTAAAIVACALGMGSKQTMALAPLVVVLWDWTFAPRPTRLPDDPGGEAAAGARRSVLYAGLAATWAILAASVVHERWPNSVGSGIEGWTPWTYLVTQTGVVVHYLRLAVLPSPLAFDYDGWRMARSILDEAPSAALLAGLFAATAIGVVRRHAWGFVGAWVFATLAPSSSLLPLPTEVAAERRMYLPLAGLSVIAVIGTYLGGRRLLRHLITSEPLRRLAGGIAAVLLVAAVVATFAMMTADRNRDFWSEERIWQDTVEKRPGNPRARLNYGVVLTEAGRLPEAETQLREAVRLKDRSAPAHANLGSVLCSQGRVEEGVSHLERALAIEPGYAAAYSNLAEAYGALGRRSEAAKYFTMAVEVRPDSPLLLSRLGWLLATSPEDQVRDGNKSVQVSERAVRLTTRQDMLALQTLAAAYAEVDRFDDAVATLREAVALAGRQGNQAAIPVLIDQLSRCQAHVKLREGQ
jgi:Flp pilus assembly protein TadD